jgi:tetratricopeptide (TPR) repeat protein
MKHTRLLMSVVISVGVAGCANPINMHTAQRYFDAGMAAEREGNYQLAHENYYRAYVNTEIGHADDQRKALAMYNLGRMKGYLCMKAEAEPLLVNSVAVEEKALSQNGGWYTGRLVEMARFYLGFGEYAKAVPYFDKATLRLVDSGNEGTNPIEMADMWDDYGKPLGDRALKPKPMKWRLAHSVYAKPMPEKRRGLSHSHMPRPARAGANSTLHRARA